MSYHYTIEWLTDDEKEENNFIFNLLQSRDRRAPLLIDGGAQADRRAFAAAY
jgi:hypothetical protein